MSDLDLTPENERDLEAAEYVLGLLPPEQACALEAAAMADPALARSVADWQTRLAPLAVLAGARTPPPELWQRLALATGIGGTVTMSPPLPRRGGVLWRSARTWRSATVAATAVAASLAFLLFSAPQAGLELQMAALTPMNAPGATYLLEVAADGSATVVAMGSAAVPQGRSLELWAVQAGATTPVSMGLLPPTGRGRLTIKLPPGTQLLVSQEPEGGSKTKLPTGPVVYSGKLTGI